jgi:hypothetical protein
MSLKLPSLTLAEVLILLRLKRAAQEFQASDQPGSQSYAIGEPAILEIAEDQPVGASLSREKVHRYLRGLVAAGFVGIRKTANQSEERFFISIRGEGQLLLAIQALDSLVEEFNDQ